MPISNAAWGRFTQADYTPEQWRRACLVDRGSGDMDSKERYAVPVREPDGTLNRNGVHAAAGGHGVGAVKGISDETRAEAARKLVRLYRDELDEEPPDSVAAMAHMSRSAQPVSSEPFTRCFHPDLHVRSAGDGRTIFGHAVPYNSPARIDEFLVEQFARGAFNHQINAPNRVTFAREHVRQGGTLIGAATMLRDDPSALYVELHASRTPKGDETLELVKDGALYQMSIMFREKSNRRLVGGVTERVRADLLEVAMVGEGAYGEMAAALGVRSGMPVPATGNTAVITDPDLRLRAEQYLFEGLPELRDPDLEIRKINLGLPF